MTTTRIRLDEIPDELSPDHSICEHCGQPISWDEICYTHDSSGFADCGVTITGASWETGMLIDPKIDSDGSETMAEPVTWFVDA